MIPQNGWDHVSGYRTTAYVISAYTRRGAVVKTQYNTTSLLRTMELMLGLPPMNQFDATATPMFDCFTNTPDFSGVYGGDQQRAAGRDESAGQADQRRPGAVMMPMFPRACLGQAGPVQRGRAEPHPLARNHGGPALPRLGGPGGCGLNPNTEVGATIETTCRKPIVGRARHSVRATPATSECKNIPGGAFPTRCRSSPFSTFPSPLQRSG